MALKLYQGTKTTAMTDGQLRFEIVRAMLKGGALDAGMRAAEITIEAAKIAKFVDPEHQPDR